jgi:hypothetical protein
VALALGMTVRDAKSRMTYREAMQWGAYFKAHGYSSRSAALVPELQRGFALLAAILINVNGGYQGGKKAKIEDFLPKRGEETTGDAEDVAALLASLWGGKKSDRQKKLWRRRNK